MKSTKSNKSFLVEIPPGRYVRCGQNGDGFKEIAKPVQGLVVNQLRSGDREREFMTVLVEGDLINYWSPENAE